MASSTPLEDFWIRACFWNYTQPSFVGLPDLSVTGFNMAFGNWDAELGTAEWTAEGASIWTRAREWSMQEPLSVLYTCWVLIGDLFLLLVYSCEPDMTVLLYASLPETMKSPGWFAVLFILEVNLHAFRLPSQGLIFPLHVPFSEKIGEVMRALEVSIQQSCRTANANHSYQGKLSHSGLPDGVCKGIP